MAPHLKPLPAWMRPQPDPESEWVGGFIQSPTYVLEPRIYRPLIAVWPESYLDFNVPPENVAGFFRACARLWRAAPWKHAEDTHLIEVSVAGTDIKEEVISIIGNLGQEFGIIRFFSATEYGVFREIATDQMDRGKPAETQGTDTVTTNFDRRKDVPASMLEEVARYGWELAEPGYLPVLVQADDDLLVRPNAAEDYVHAAAIAEAVAAFTEAHPGIFADPAPAPVRFAWTHRGHTGPVKVRLRIPCPDGFGGTIWGDGA